jgi:hypothetical protein
LLSLLCAGAGGAADLDDAVRDYSGQQPVLPGAEGYGINTPAGRGGQVLRVTSLAAEGAGSLRAALAAPGPRMVVFEVGGVIALRDPLIIDQPCVTVAGQTAPEPGIAIIGAGLFVTASDVLVQHLRIRVGDRPEGPAPDARDALSVYPGPEARPTRKVVIDHCSLSWAVDECASTWGAVVSDVTFRQCVFAEGLSRSIHPKGEHSKGLLLGDHARRIAVIGNLFAHNMQRNPFVKGDVSALIVNNLVYNPGVLGIHFGDHEKSGPSLAVVMGNVFVPGPGTVAQIPLVTLQTDMDRATRVYAFDNDPGNRREWMGLMMSACWTALEKPEASPVRVTPLTVRPSARVKEWVLASAGARPAHRDAVDARIIRDVREGTGRIIDHPGEAGGFPADTLVRKPLSLPADPNGDADGNGYTNLEDWLHGLARAVEWAP